VRLFFSSFLCAVSLLATDTTASSLGLNLNTNDDAFFKCIQKAHEVLTNPERRRQFDSVDPAFLEEVEDVPSLSDFKVQSLFSAFIHHSFCRQTRRLSFQHSRPSSSARRASHVSSPLPSWLSPLVRIPHTPAIRTHRTIEGDAQPSSDPDDIKGHAFPALKAHVEAFYDFWYNFDSWRSFEWMDKEVNEGSDRCVAFSLSCDAYLLYRFAVVTTSGTRRKRTSRSVRAESVRISRVCAAS